MKKDLFFPVLVFTVLTTLLQRLRLNANCVNNFDDGFESKYDPNTFFVGETNGRSQWVGAFGYLTKRNSYFEVQYLHQTTEVLYTYKLGINSQTNSETPTLTIDTFMFGSYGHVLNMSGKVKCYAGLFLGTAPLRASNFSCGKGQISFQRVPAQGAMFGSLINQD